MLFKSPKEDFSHTKMFSRFRFFLFGLSREAFKTSLNFPRSPFWSACKALWGDDVRWLLVQVVRICSGHLFGNKLRIMILKRCPLSRISLNLNILPVSKERKNRLIQGGGRSLFFWLFDTWKSPDGPVSVWMLLDWILLSNETQCCILLQIHLEHWKSRNHLTSSPQIALRANQNGDRGEFELVLKASLGKPKGII